MNSTVKWLKTNAFEYLKVDSGGCYNDMQLWHDLLVAAEHDIIVENCHQGAQPPNETWCPYDLWRGQFSMEDPDLLLRIPDFLFRNLDFLLKNVDFIIQQSALTSTALVRTMRSSVWSPHLTARSRERDAGRTPTS